MEITKPKDWEVEIDWHLTNRCNFHCEYCFPQIRIVLNRKHLDEPSPEAVEKAFEAFGATCLIHMSGGEPFLFPSFTELCRLLTQRHYISINTNLSDASAIAEFAAVVPASRVVSITAALHIQERERLGLSVDSYADNLSLLTPAAFEINPLYVLHPSLMYRVDEDLSHLKHLGVEGVHVKVFKGIWEGREYPEAYSAEDRTVLGRLGTDYRYTDSYLAGIRRSFRGSLCSAGMTSFKVTVTGEVQRCATVPHSYGNIYAGTFAPEVAKTACTAAKVKVVSQCLSYSDAVVIAEDSELIETPEMELLARPDSSPPVPS